MNLLDLQRIASPSFVPTVYDILRSYEPTSTTTTHNYNVGGVDFEMYDTGGRQLLEAENFPQCLEQISDKVDAIIFVASLAAYDETCSNGTNCMAEALEKFKYIVTNPPFVDMPIVLILNKHDIFAQKISHSDIISHGFTDYSGPPMDSDYGANYFINKFEEHVLIGGEGAFACHVHCGTNSNSILHFCDSLTREILDQLLQQDISRV